ncbi:MAG: glycosyltransferase family 4 protein, partial [Acidimicrobiales bacterium]
MTEAGSVVVDLRAAQSPDHRGRGVGSYAVALSLALERCRPDLVGRYLLAPDWPPPAVSEILALVASGKVAYAGTPGSMPGSARVYHSMSPFELGAATSQIWPPEVEHLGLRFSTMAFDLIPLKMPADYLADARMRRRYRARLELVRLADAVLAISETTRGDVIDLLGVEPGRVTSIGTGTSGDLVPPDSLADAAEAAAAAVPGLRTPFVLYPGGSDGRKNIERLIRAFADLDEPLREGHQLVVACDLPPLMANHFRVVAESLDVSPSLLMTGHVTTEALKLMYQSSALVCYPSLAEGYGLPVAEAIACGAPVVASDRPPLDELVPSEARFDPLSVDSIRGAIERGLTDGAFRAEALQRSRERRGIESWDDVADRAAKIFDQLSAPPPRPWRRAPRLAVVSPFPPVQSGVSSYSARLVEALAHVLERAAPGAELVCFADGLDRHSTVAAPEQVGDGLVSSEHAGEVSASPVPVDARELLASEAVTGGFDHVVYV